MKTTVIYITIVGILFFALLAVLNIGEKIVAPDNISGKWELDPEFIEDIDKSCTLVFTSQKNNIALIEQSGVYLTITFNDKSKTIMHGELKNGKMIFEKVFASNNKLNNPCGAETLTELTIELIKKDDMPDQLLGTWKNPECGECAVIQFSAVKQQAEG